MKKLFFIFGLMLTFTVRPLLSAIDTKPQGSLQTYNTDPRRYFAKVEDRGRWPYNVIVQIVSAGTYRDPRTYMFHDEYTSCTGTMVSKDYMLTAGHCTTEKGQTIDFILTNGLENFRINGDVVARVYNDCGDDFSIIKVSSADDKTKSVLANMRFPDIKSSVSGNDNLLSIGYGALRVVSDQDLDYARDVMLDYIKGKIDATAPAKAEPTSEDSLKFSSANDESSALTVINKKMSEQKKLPLTPEYGYAKMNNNCKVKNLYENRMETSCMIYGGDSGGPVIENNGGDNYAIVGVISCRLIDQMGFSGKDKTKSYVTPPNIYYDTLMGFLHPENNTFNPVAVSNNTATVKPENKIEEANNESDDGFLFSRVETPGAKYDDQKAMAYWKANIDKKTIGSMEIYDVNGDGITDYVIYWVRPE